MANMPLFNMDWDRGGRYRKVYKKHVEPDLEWRDEHFVRRYRLSKERLRDLSLDFGPYSRTEGTNVGGGLSHFQQVCIAVRYLATGATYMTVADAHKTSTAAVSRVVEDLSDYFYDTCNRYIRWPYRLQDKMRIARGFYANGDGNPMIMGCIDGTHISIISPHHNREAVFVNRKGFYSINAMVVCDSKNIITHLDTTLAGSANDQYAFNTSTLFDEAETVQSWDGFALLGDSGYSLKKYMLTPYFRPDTDRQHAYNNWHMSARSVVERTIGLMKQRWRCLDAHGGYLYHTPERCAKIIVACGCLHNLAVADRAPVINVLEDVAEDAFRAVRVPIDAPQDYHQNPVFQGVEDARDVYARRNYGNLDNGPLQRAIEQ